MKKTASILLLLLILLLVACQDEASETTEGPEDSADPEPTAAAVNTSVEEASPEPTEETEVSEATDAPTEVPTEEPAAEPTAEPIAEEPAAEEPTAEAAEAGDTMDNSLDEEIAQLAIFSPPPQLSERELGIHILPCDPARSPGADEVEGEDYYCGVFTVPQNWEEPDGRNLDLAFVVAKATGENPVPDPLIFLTGGPGQSAVHQPLDAYGQLRTDHDILRLDQRGTGSSQRLSFEECLVLALQNGAPADQIAALRESAVNPFEQGSINPPLEEQDHPVVNATCSEQFTAQGLDLDQFSTAASARDVVEFVKALEYESFNIHGVSYGTRLAMTIMNNMPGYDDAPELRSVVLDSTFPPSVYLVRTDVRSRHDWILQLLDECQADTACNEAYPNLTGRLAALLNRLEEEPLSVSGEMVTVDDVVEQLTDPTRLRAAYMPKMIAELEMGVLDTYLALRDGEVGGAPIDVSAIELDPSDPVQAFIADSLALVGDEEAFEFKFYIDVALVQEDPLSMIQAAIAESDAGETGDQMLEMLGALTAEDITNSPYVAQLPKVEIPAESEGDPQEQLEKQRNLLPSRSAHFLYNAIHCNEDIQFERYEDAVNNYNDLLFPQLVDLVRSQAMANQCENWPFAATPIEVKDPVTSDIPALILQGAYDNITPITMGRRADRELENGTYVVVPYGVHVTWTSGDNCVGQIAAAYIQDPQDELDTSCLDALQPQWVLPGGGE
ncbi:MAG: alpha/beta fold hydrolase [Chloroflexi bacterium]|jgi:pimeloyl-ACP methyl ester carboxylesterase|nr:alpha/beta fold hydrolase [Chloroflexota bacterium]